MSLLRNIKKKSWLLLVLVLLSGIVLPTIDVPKAHAAGETINGGAPVSGARGVPIAISDLSITVAGNPTIPVQLQVSSGELAMSTTTGLTFTGSPTGSHLVFSGTKNNLNTALATLTYTAEEADSTTIEMSLTEPGEVFSPVNGHLYEYIQAPLVSIGEDVFMPQISWDDAKAAAEGMTKYGYTGYLVTVTSSAESEYIIPRLEGSSWMGSSDAANEGDWRWVTGPEGEANGGAGTAFWSGAIGGNPVGGAYANWSVGNEPNDMGDEDCGQFLAGGESEGTWNDLPCESEATLPGYVVEYGEETPIAIATKTIAVTVNANTAEVATCEELESLDDSPGSEVDSIELTADIDCHGATIASLFKDYEFAAEFDGNDHTIRNVVIDEDSDEVGIISQSDNANYHDIRLENISVTGTEDVAALVGDSSDDSFEDIHANGITVHMEGSEDGGEAGGLIGEYSANMSTTLKNLSVSDGEVTASSGYNVGGLIGLLDVDSEEGVVDVTVEKVYSELDVTGGEEPGDSYGGLIGQVETCADEEGAAVNLDLHDAYAWGDVNATQIDSVGGLIGDLNVEQCYELSDGAHVDIARVYASGAVSGDDAVGGLIGRHHGIYGSDSVTLSNSFAMGAVTAGPDNDLGALIGDYYDDDENIVSTNNYFDLAGTGVDECDNLTALDDCTAINELGTDPDYFINNTTSPPLDTWDFETIWVTHSDTPPTFQEIEESSDEDLNGDNIPDSEQPNVGGYVNPITGKIVAINVGEGCELTTDDYVRESQLAVQDAAYEYDNGLWDFEADCGTPGYTTTVSLYYYDVAKDGKVLRKHNPATNAFFTITDASIATQTINGHSVTVVTYQITDGGERDTDGAINGQITDPAGLARAVVGAPNTGL